MKATKPASARKSAAKNAAKKRGNLTANEIKPLIMAANKAYRIQEQSGNLDSGETFNSWRKAQCLEAVGLPGITACNHIHFRPLLAHFQTLAGDDNQAFKTLMTTGKSTDHAAPGDTHEERGVLVSLIAEALAAHMHLSNTAEDVLLAEAQAVHEIYEAGLPWEGSATNASFHSMLISKAAVTAKGKGPLTVGYVVYLTRQKTRRPDLTLGNDWKVGLAERCTVKQLTQIRDTLVNRIAAIEGVGSNRTRNKSQRSPKTKAARDKKELTPRW